MISVVTGGAGFIGSHLVNELISRGETEVHVIDSLTYAADLDRLPNPNKKEYFFHKLDISNKLKLDETFSLITERSKDAPISIYNAAAESHVDRSIVNASQFIESNILGTQNLVELSSKYRIKRFLQVSTDEVYGSISKGEAHETFHLNPSSAYAASKASADLLVMAHARTHGLDTIITRCVNNFGTGQLNEKFIPRMIYKSILGEDLPIYGDGSNVREWLHVSDHVNALILCMHAGSANSIYNIGSGERIDNLTIAQKIIAQIPGSKSEIKFVRDRPGHDERYAVSSSKIREELLWKPALEFNSILEETVKSEIKRMLAENPEKLLEIENFYAK